MRTLDGAPTGATGLRINNSAGTSTTLVAAVAGKVVRVYCLRLSVAAAVVVNLQDGAGAILEVFNFAAAGSYSLPLREEPYYTTTAGNALVMNSTAVQVDGRLEYAQVGAAGL